MSKKALVIIGVWGIALAALFAYGRMKKHDQQTAANSPGAESASEVVFLAPGFT